MSSEIARFRAAAMAALLAVVGLAGIALAPPEAQGAVFDCEMRAAASVDVDTRSFSSAGAARCDNRLGRGPSVEVTTEASFSSPPQAAAAGSIRVEVDEESVPQEVALRGAAQAGGSRTDDGFTVGFADQVDLGGDGDNEVSDGRTDVWVACPSPEERNDVATIYCALVELGANIFDS